MSGNRFAMDTSARSLLLLLLLLVAVVFTVRAPSCTSRMCERGALLHDLLEPSSRQAFVAALAQVMFMFSERIGRVAGNSIRFCCAVGGCDLMIAAVRMPRCSSYSNLVVLLFSNSPCQRRSPSREGSYSEDRVHLRPPTTPPEEIMGRPPGHHR